MDFDKTHLNILSIIKTFCSSLPDQLSRLCPPHFYLPILTFLDWIYIVWTFYSYGHFTLWTFSDSSNLYGHFITMDNFPYGFFTHRSILWQEYNVESWPIQTHFATNCYIYEFLLGVNTLWIFWDFSDISHALGGH